MITIVGLIHLLSSYFQIRPDHEKFRNGPPANLDQQDVMFRKAHVTGESATIAGEETVGGNEAPILLDDEAPKKTGKRKYGEKEKENPFSRYTTML